MADKFEMLADAGLSETGGERIMEPGAGKILLFDDDVELCELIAKSMLSHNFEFHFSPDPEKDFALVESLKPQMILLDVGFKFCNGFDILRKIRKVSDISVIMLTARGDELDRVLGLELGADDYLPKPFYMRELIARIKAVFRRKHSHVADDCNFKVIEYADLKVNLNARTLLKGGQNVELTSREFDLLVVLVENANKVTSKEEISEKLFNRAFDTIDRSLDVHLSRLRKKLGNSPDGIDRIRTIRGKGVIFS
ncbi:MAG: response regulator transcription factor [Candidatus Riflebacteria bacterium]